MAWVTLRVDTISQARVVPEISQYVLSTRELNNPVTVAVSLKSKLGCPTLSVKVRG